MNKYLKITLIVISVFILLGISFAINPSSKEKKEKVTEDSADSIIEQAEKDSQIAKENGDLSDFNQVKIDDYLEYLSGEEDKMLLVARPTCTYCQMAEPILQNISYEYNIEIDYLNTDDFSEDDNSKFISSAEEFKEGFGTPMLLVVSNGKINDMVDGLTIKKKYIEFMKNHKFIK